MKQMKKKIPFLFLVLSAFIAYSCSSTDRKFLSKDYFLEEKGVLVSSCPSNVKFTINDQECVTPCKLTFPDDTLVLKVEHNGKVGYVQTYTSPIRDPKLNGLLLITNVKYLDSVAGSPNAPIFFESIDTGLVDLCGPQHTAE